MSQPTYRVAVDPTMPGFWCVWSDRHDEPLATGLSLATAQAEVDALTERAGRAPCTFPGCVEHECQLCGRIRSHDAAVAEGPCDCGPEHWEALDEPLTPGERAAAGWTPEPDALDGTDLARVLAILDGWAHDAQRGNALASGDPATYSALIRSLAEARTVVERHILAHREPMTAREAVQDTAPARCALTFRRTLDEATVRCTRPAGHGGYCNSYGDPWDGPIETSARQ